MLALVTDASPSGVSLVEVAAPTPAADQAVVAVKAVSLNRGEVRMLPGAPGRRPGWDVAGVIARAAADGSGPAVGARVFGYVPSLVSDAPGTWAQQVAVSTRRLAVLDDRVSFADASTVPIAGLTALAAVERGGALRGTKVLVTGASGAVGAFAIELARHAGAEVTALVDRPERAQAVRADHVATTLDAAVGPFALVVESVGGATLGHALTQVAAGGAIVSFGNSSGQTTTFDVTRFFLEHRARLEGYIVFADDPGTRELAQLSSHVADGVLHPRVALTTSWREAGAAIAAVRDRKIAGKAVLTVD